MGRRQRLRRLRQDQQAAASVKSARGATPLPTADAQSERSPLGHHWLQQLTVILFHVLVLTVPFYFTWTNEELFEFPKLMLTYSLTIGIAAAWLLRMLLERRIILRRSPLDLPLLLFLGSQVLSTLFSIHPRTSWLGYYTRFHGGLLSTLAYLVLYWAFVSNVTRAHLSKFWLTLFVGALGVTLYSIPEHFGVSPSCILINSDQVIKSHQPWFQAIASDPNRFFTVNCWVQDVQNRIFGTFGQPNWLAAYIITLWPLGVVLTLDRKRSWWSALFYGGTTLALTATLLFTQSRSGVLGWVAGAGIMGLGMVGLSLFGRATSKIAGLPSFSPLRALALAAGVIGIVAWFGTPFTPRLSEILKRWQSSTVSVEQATTTAAASPATQANTTAVDRLGAGGTDSGEIRKIVWAGSWEVWKRYPLLGSGVETFAYSYYQDRPLEHNLVSEWDFLYNKAHNEFLNFLATTGLVGLSTYLILLVSIIWLAIRLIFTPKDSVPSLGLATISGLTALSISNFFGFSTVMVTILLFLYPAWMVVTSSPEKWVNVNKKRPTSSTGLTNLSLFQYIGVLAVLLVATALLFSVRRTLMADKSYAEGQAYIDSGYAAQGVEKLLKATQLLPQEALYYDQLASDYSRLASAFYSQGDASAAAQLAAEAITMSDQALTLNDRHVNFYKTRTRMFISLATLDPAYLLQAESTLLKALELAPTDAKLRYNLALVRLSIDKKEAGLQDLEATVAMKPNYEAARSELAKQYLELNRPADALAQLLYIVDHITRSNEDVNQRIATLRALLESQQATSSGQLDNP